MDGYRWDFLTHHAHVLLCIAGDPGVRLRDIASSVGITERAAHRIVSELCDDGYVVKERQGRRNHYKVRRHESLRHPLVQNHQIGELLSVLIPSSDGKFSSDGKPSTARNPSTVRKPSSDG